MPTPRDPQGPQGHGPQTWVVLLIVFGLMGIGGPILALILFFLIASLT